MAEKKLCPLAKDACLGEACACYISIVKPAFISKTHGIIDPERYYRYIGCGLVNTIPWQLCAKLENIEK